MKIEYTMESNSKKRYKTYLFGVFIAVVMVLSCVYFFVYDSEDAAADGEVARIGEVEYNTLGEAVDAVTEGQTIVLIADVNERITVNKTFTLDLNGHIMNSSDPGDSTIYIDSGTLTVIDGNSSVAHAGTVVDHRWTTTAGETIINGGIITGGSPGIYVCEGAGLVLNGGNVAGNIGYYEGRYGGGIFSRGTVMIGGGNVLYNICNNGEAGIGGGMRSYGTFTMTAGSISNNYARSTGGGLQIEGESSITGGIISGNESAQGGGMQVSSTSSTTIGGTAVVRDNIATFGPGAYLSSTTCSLTITGNAEFRNNKIYIQSGTLTMNGGTVGYTASDSGVNVNSSNSVFNMSGGTIRDCVQPSPGAGVLIENGGTFNMSGGTITGCSSTGGTANGGGVSVSGVNSVFNMSGTALISNCSSSRNGGGVYLSSSDGCTFNMSGGTITGCTSTPYNNQHGTGAGIWSGGTLNITGGEISNCISHATNVARAENGGGAIYIRIGSATISGISIHDNSVEEDCRGDAVYVRMESTSVSINKTNITGDIYFKNKDAPTLLAYVDNNNVITAYNDVDDAFVAAGTTGIVGILVDVTVDDGDEMTVYNMAVLEGVTVTVDGNVTYNGNVTNNGTMVVGATGVLNGNGVCINNGIITNGGAIIINGSIVDNGVITNNGTITVTVVFNANTGTGSMGAQNVPYNSATALTVNAFTKEGYKFVGWNTAADGSGTAYTDAQSVTINSGLLLYAQWVMVYTIAFNANGGAGGVMADLDATVGFDVVLTANAFSKDGYAFGGWATAVDGKALYSDKATVKNLTSTAGATVTLYAVWIQVEKTDNAAVITVTTDAVSDQAAEQLVEAAKQMKDSGKEDVSVDVKATETEAVSIKSDSVKDAVDSGIGVNIATSKGAMEFSSEALAGLIEDGKTLKSEIKPIEVPPAYAEKIPADAKVFSISLTSDDVAITSFGAKFTVKVAYEASGDTDKLYVGYLAADGTIQKMESHYEDGFMVFTTDHLSDYAVLEDSSSPSSSGNNQGLLLAIFLVAAIVLPIIAALIIFREK